jgi:hypothetical protein
MNIVLAILVCFNSIVSSSSSSSSSSSAEPIQDDFTFRRRYSLRATNNNMRLTPPRLLGFSMSMSMSMPEIPNPNLVPCGTFDSIACPETMTSVVDSVSPSTNEIPTVVVVDISQPTTDNKEEDVDRTSTTTDGSCRRDSDCSGSVDQISTKTCECRFECAFCSMIPMFHVQLYCGTCV